jgi:hypothetical protein
VSRRLVVFAAAMVLTMWTAAGATLSNDSSSAVTTSSLLSPERPLDDLSLPPVVNRIPPQPIATTEVLRGPVPIATPPTTREETQR